MPLTMATSPVATEWRWAVERARAPRLRTMRQFGEQELILPDGPFAGRRFRVDRLPYAGLWLDAVDSGLWSEIVSTGPTQAGKTLLCYCLPVCYHLFEIGETVVCGVPNLDMAADKWRQDLEPVILKSRYRDLLPSRGGGSRGGRVASIRFANGATLRWMTGGAGDKGRAGFTSRVVAITETDGLDTSSEQSHEASKIKQLEGRTRAFLGRRRIYKECTVTVEQGHTWQRYQQGTASRIVVPCPGCRAWVAPEREHLDGWQQAASEMEARQKAAFRCPACARPFTDAERIDANHAARLLHAGQEIDAEGRVTGEPPPTRTLGFRWSAFHNLFTTAAELGAEEWKAARARNEDDAEREMRQFVWCLPYEPPLTDETPLDADALRRRFGNERRGFVPRDTACLAMHVDPGKRVGWWLLVAWRSDGSPHVVERGTLEIAGDQMKVDRAILAALRDFREGTIAKGWPVTGEAGPPRLPDQVWIDARYQPKAVAPFCEESGDRYRPAMGHGSGPAYVSVYRAPTTRNRRVRFVGDHYHLARHPQYKILFAAVDADYWKARSHDHLATPEGDPGAITLYHSSDRNEHTTLAKHFTAEKRVQEWIAGRGMVTRWVRESRANHHLDNFYNCCAIADYWARRPKTKQSTGWGRAAETEAEAETDPAAAVVPPPRNAWFSRTGRRA